jgi:hypothetical protein
MFLFGSKDARDLWRSIPPKTLLIFLIAVFFTFAVMGIIEDVAAMGHETPIRFAAGVVLPGLFAVCYAFGGITLRRRKFWIWVFFPLLAFQIGVMTLLANLFPDTPHSDHLNVAETTLLQQRLGFDTLAIVISVAVGYSLFVWAFVREGRRHVSIHKEKALLENEIEAARQIQHFILPESGQNFPGFRVQSAYTPAQQVGGDFFQLLSDNSGGILLILGDVSGKGLPAAMLVSMLVGAIRTAAEETTDPAHILHTLHERLIGRTGGGFSTALAAHIAKDGSITIANAGHLSPYIDGKEIALPGALPLGISGGGQYETTSLMLNPASHLTFYTDGVVEAQTPNKELFGFDRAQSISTQSAAAIAQTAVEFGQSDDITVVTIERV